MSISPTYWWKVVLYIPSDQKIPVKTEEKMLKITSLKVVKVSTRLIILNKKYNKIVFVLQMYSILQTGFNLIC